jgi:type IV pilus assembly protein PilE
MIVVAVVSILAAIAYPSYQEHVRKGRRADAKAALMENAQYMERFYTENFRYDQKKGGGAPVLPVTTSPKEGGTTFYNISFDGTVGQTSFSLQAVPQGNQAKDRCGTLTLDNTGKKGTKATGMTVNECWN